MDSNDNEGIGVNEETYQSNDRKEKPSFSVLLPEKESSPSLTTPDSGISFQDTDNSFGVKKSRTMSLPLYGSSLTTLESPDHVPDDVLYDKQQKGTQ